MARVAQPASRNNREQAPVWHRGSTCGSVRFRPKPGLPERLVTVGCGCPPTAAIEKLGPGERLPPDGQKRIAQYLIAAGTTRRPGVGFALGAPILPVEHQAMQMNVRRRVKALAERDRTGVGCGAFHARLLEQPVPGDRSLPAQFPSLGRFCGHFVVSARPARSYDACASVNALDSRNDVHGRRWR